MFEVSWINARGILQIRNFGLKSSAVIFYCGIQCDERNTQLQIVHLLGVERIELCSERFPEFGR